MPDVLPDRSEVTKFDHGKLKHVEPTEKVVLPSKEGESKVSFYKKKHNYIWLLKKQTL